MSKEDNYLFKVIGSIVMRYNIEKPNPETLAVAQKIIDLVEKATEQRIIKLLEADKRFHSYFYAQQVIKVGAPVLPFVETHDLACPGCDLIALIEGQNK